MVPRLIAQQGHTVLHAGAVSLAEDSRAIAFIGPTGSGKSTLSALFSKHGASLLTDDCLRIDFQDSQTLAFPAYPSIRFWENDHDLLLPEYRDQSTSQSTSYSSKRCLQFGQFPYTFCKQPARLNTLYLLIPENSGNQHISITPASKAETVSFLTANCFRLDVEDLNQLENEFHQLIDLSKRIPAFRLSYPKNWDKIEDLRLAVLNHEKKSNLTAFIQT